MPIVSGKKDKYRIILAHSFLICFLIAILFPLIMIISISFREGNFATGSIIPKNPTLEHWKLALGISYTTEDGKVVKPPFPVLKWLWNSIKIAGVSSFLILLLSTTCAYAFARMKFRFKNQIINSLLVLQMFPIVLALIAIYAIFETLGYFFPALGIDTHAGLTLSYLGFITLHIWTIRGYFSTVPVSMEESALIDGATHFQTFRYILLPMSVPILAVVFILAFIYTITEYPVASILLHKIDNLTLAVGANYYLYEQNYLWGDFAAAAVLSGIPITIAFIICQRWLVSGLTKGGAKG